MVSINEQFGSGGANVAPGKTSGEHSIGEALMEIADDLQGHQPLVVTAADASDLATAVTLVNQMKAILNGVAPRKGTVRGTTVGPWNIEPAQTLLVAIDGGGAATATFNAAAAVMTAAVGPYDLRGAPNLRIKLNGGPEFNVQFKDADFSNPAAATATEVANAIDAVLPASATLSVSSSATRITTARRGLGAAIQVVGGSARAKLGGGFASTTAIRGTGNVADIDAVTFGEVKAVVEAAVAGSEVQNVAGRLLIRTETEGPSGSCAVTGGTAAAALGLADTTVRPGTNATASRTARA